jgi:hypothetical protein
MYTVDMRILTLLPGEKNQKSKEMLRGKVAEYMERAEKLKAHLNQNDAANRKKPSAMGANGKVAGGSGKGKYVAIHPSGSTYYLHCALEATKKTTARTPTPRSSAVR